MVTIWRNTFAAAVVASWGLSVVPATAAQTDQIDAHIRNDVLQQLASVLESQYAIEDTAKKLATFLRSKSKSNAYKGIASGSEFARVVTDDLKSVAHDKHLRVSFGLLAGPPPPMAPAGPVPPEMLSRMRKENGAIPRVEILDGNVGYMRVNGVPPVEAASSAVAAAFAFVRNTDALIIDDRGNGGGDPHTVALYVSYLSEGEPFVVNTFHRRVGNSVEIFRSTNLGDLSYGGHKPVYVLTSPITFSGGEELAYDLQALKRAVVVGETTGGGAHPVDRVQLGHQFAADIPDAQGINPITGTDWEGIGVVPEVAMPSGKALSKAHELAIARLRAMATDPLTRAELDGVAMELQTIAEAEFGSAVRLTTDQLVGTYRNSEIPSTTVLVLEKEGRLIRRIDGLPDRVLTYSRGNRYAEEGLPEGFFISFRERQGKLELLLETPSGPSIIREREITTGAH